jgi:leader peptidase (prepilin peptidase)/N-methyltransferase
VTAAVLAVLAGRFGGQPDLLAYTFAGTVGVALAAIDLAVQRLPDRMTLPSVPALVCLLALAAVLDRNGGALARALLGGLALGGCYLVLAIAGRGQLGGGDVKLAGLAGLAMGWLGWSTLLAGAALGFLLAAAASVVLLARRRVTLRSAISFGPYLLAGALVAIVASAPPRLR